MDATVHGCVNNLPDEWLAQHAQVGDAEAEAILAARYESLVHCEADGWAIPGHSHEDLAATMRLGVLKAIRTYEEGKGTKFKTYAKRIMRRCLTDLWRKVHAGKRVPDSRTVGSVFGEDAEGEAVTLEDSVAAPVDYEAQAVAAATASDLVGRLLGVCRAVLNGMAQGDLLKDTAEGLGVPDRVVSLIAQGLRQAALHVAADLAP